MPAGPRALHSAVGAVSGAPQVLRWCCAPSYSAFLHPQTITGPMMWGPFVLFPTPHRGHVPGCHRARGTPTYWWWRRGTEWRRWQAVKPATGGRGTARAACRTCSMALWTPEAKPARKTARQTTTATARTKLRPQTIGASCWTRSSTGSSRWSSCGSWSTGCCCPS
ncbi:FAGR063Wp [Eremothecium gossypii FDAG1]|nr:FAGR063Wp [Eremothecium gossypii FDAG1]